MIENFDFFSRFLYFKRRKLIVLDPIERGLSRYGTMSRCTKALDTYVLTLDGEGHIKISPIGDSGVGTPRQTSKFPLPSWRSIAAHPTLSRDLARLEQDPVLRETSGYAAAARFWQGKGNVLKDSEYNLLICSNNYRVLDYLKFAIKQDRQNVLICDNANEISKLTTEFFPELLVLLVGRYNPEPPAPESVEEQARWIAKGVALRVHTNVFWEDVPLPREVSIGSLIWYFRYSSFGQHLARKGVPVFCDMNEAPNTWPMGYALGEIESLPDRQTDFERVFAAACGFERIIRPEPRTITAGYSTSFFPPVRLYDTLTWDMLKREFRVPAVEMTGTPVLFLDQPIWTVEGVNIPATIELLTTFLKKLKARDVTIHIKPHPSFRDKTFLDGNEDLFTRSPFPAWIPAQLICEQYQAVMFYYSTSVEAVAPNARYTLYPLMRFNDDAKGVASSRFSREFLDSIGAVAGEVSEDEMEYWADTISEAVKAPKRL